MRDKTDAIHNIYDLKKTVSIDTVDKPQWSVEKIIFLTEFKALAVGITV